MTEVSSETINSTEMRQSVYKPPPISQTKSTANLKSGNSSVSDSRPNSSVTSTTYKDVLKVIDKPEATYNFIEELFEVLFHIKRRETTIKSEVNKDLYNMYLYLPLKTNFELPIRY